MSSAQTQQHQAPPIKRTETVGARVEKYLQGASTDLAVPGEQVGAAVDILMQKLKDPSVAPSRLMSAFAALDKIDSNATTQALLLQLTQSTTGSAADDGRFMERVYVLSKIPSQSAEAALIQFIETFPDAESFRREAAGMLAGRNSLTPNGAMRILKLATIVDPVQRECFLEALGNTTPPDAAVAEFLRRAAKSEPSWQIQTTAATSLMRQGDLSAIEYLEPVTKGQLFQHGLADAAMQSGDPKTQWRAFRAMANASDGGFNGVWLDSLTKAPLSADLKSAVLDALRKTIAREDDPAYGFAAAARVFATLAPTEARQLFAERSLSADGSFQEAMAGALLGAGIRDLPPLLMGYALQRALRYLPPQDRLDRFSSDDRGSFLTLERANIISGLLRSGSSPAFAYAVWGELTSQEQERKFTDPAVLDVVFANVQQVASLATMLRAAAAGSPPDAPAMERYARSLEQSSKFGIEHPLRFTPEALNGVISEREARKDLPRAVVIMPKSDWNGAFTNTRPVVDKLQASGYSVLVYEVGSDTEFAAALRDASTDRKISALVLGGHGERGAVELRTTEPKDSHATLDLRDVTLLRSVAATMAEGSQVVLWSCSTGEGGATSSNMANLIRRVWPQVQPEGIFAPRVPTNIEELKIEKNRIWDVVYTDQPSEQPQAAPIKYQALSFPPLSMFGRARGA